MLVALDTQEGLTEASSAIVEIVGSHSEALARMKIGGADAAIVDIDLKSSSAASRAMIATGVPVVFVSSYAASVVLAENLTAVPFVSKPYLLEDLLAALVDAVEN